MILTVKHLHSILHSGKHLPFPFAKGLFPEKSIFVCTGFQLCNLIPPKRSLAVGQSHLQVPDLPNKVVKPVDKFRQVRYNFYGILGVWSYLIIPWIAGSSEPAFLFPGTKMEHIRVDQYLFFILQPDGSQSQNSGSDQFEFFRNTFEKERLIIGFCKDRRNDKT